MAAVMALALAASSATACTKKTAVDGTEDPAQSSDVSGETSTPSDVDPSDTVETTAFDINDYSFDTIYGSQLPEYLNVQYYFNGQEVPLAESNFYFINAYLELTEYAGYGYYPANEDGFLDLEAEIDYGEGEEGKYSTYSEFFVEYSERMLASTCAICKLANEKGLTLSTDTLDAIDSMIEELDVENAQPNGVTLDEYLALYYGDSCTAEAFRNVMIDYYLADLYTTQFMDEYQPDEETAAAYTYPVVRYALFSAPADTATEEDLDNARQMAEALVEAAGGDIDMLLTLGQASVDAGSCAQCSDISVPRGRTVQAFEDWAWDEARTDGELDVIYAEEYGYFAVGFVGNQLDQDSLSDMAVSALGDYVSSLLGTEGYVLSTDPNAEPAQVLETEAEGEDETEPEGDAETEASETTEESEAA